MRVLFALASACLAISASAIAPDNPAAFPGIVRLGDPSGATITTNGSGVAISPTWVLCAWHVGGSRVEQDGEIFTVLQSVPHPTCDLRLLRLDRPIRTMTDAKLDLFGVNPTAQVSVPGIPISIVGYGLTGVRTNIGYLLTQNTFGTRRVGQNAIDLFIPNVPVTFGTTTRSSDYLWFDLDDPLGQSAVNILGGPAVSTLEGHIATFDSGGGWFVNEAGRQRLVAINSIVGTFSGTGVTNAYNWGGVAGAVNIQSYAPWVNSTVTDKGRVNLRSVTFNPVATTTGSVPDSIFEADAARFSSSTNTTAVDTEFSMNMTLSGHTTRQSVSSMSITMKGRSDSGLSAIFVQLRNWNTGLFETVDIRDLVAAETTQTVQVLNASRFARASDGRVDLRLQALPVEFDTSRFKTSYDLIRIDTN